MSVLTVVVAVSAGLIVCASGGPVLAISVTVNGPADTQCAMIVEGYTGHENYGGWSYANVMPIDYGYRDNILLRFELPSLGLSDPGGIRSAKLVLWRNDWLSREGILRLYRLTESWGEGSGYHAVLDGAADWNHRFHGSVAWSVPGAVGGGSSLSTPSAVYAVTGEYRIEMDVTEDVRWWYQNGRNLQNFGWVMTGEDSDGLWRYGIRFYSDDFSLDYGRPALTIQAVPEPLTMIAVAFGLCGLGGYVRRRK